MTDTTKLDTTPLIEWTKPESDGQDTPSEDNDDAIAAAAAAANNPEDTSATDVFAEAFVVQPAVDSDDLVEIVENGGNNFIPVGETIDKAQIDNLRDLGYTVIEQSLEEANYHVHAEVSPGRGPGRIPLSHTHRIPVSAKSEIEAKAKAKAHAKERGWTVHNISKVTLAEENVLDEGAEEGELDDQSVNEPTKFSEITAPMLEDETTEKHEVVEEDTIPFQTEGFGTAVKKMEASRQRALKRAAAMMKRTKTPLEKAAEIHDVTVKDLRNHLGLNEEINESIADVMSKEFEPTLDESYGMKVHHFDDFKHNVQSHSDHTTHDGNVKYEHKVVGAGKKKWHQTVATVVDRDGNNYIRGVFNHKHGKNSPHGHGWTSSPYGDDED